jgi:hypothetical protein
MSKAQPAIRTLMAIGVLLSAALSSTALAQEVRYSWIDIGYLAQDVSLQGSQTPVAGQTVDVNTSDGDGVLFRASFGTWHNLYAFIDYGSSDITVEAVITNNNGVFITEDEFDYTTIRGGVGLALPLRYDTDLFAELTYDSVDFDFGSFAGENFDMGDKDFGGTFGIRSMFGDNLQLQLWGRLSAMGDADLNTQEFNNDTLIGAGFGYTVIRGLSIVGEFETGTFSSWSIGFRLDLDED